MYEIVISQTIYKLYEELEIIIIIIYFIDTNRHVALFTNW